MVRITKLYLTISLCGSGNFFHSKIITLTNWLIIMFSQVLPVSQVKNVNAFLLHISIWCLPTVQYYCSQWYGQYLDILPYSWTWKLGLCFVHPKSTACDRYHYYLNHTTLRNFLNCGGWSKCGKSDNMNYSALFSDFYVKNKLYLLPFLHEVLWRGGSHHIWVHVWIFVLDILITLKTV